jgi:hypothetical protein
METVRILLEFPEGADMQSSLIGKIEKANRYAQERGRITFTDFRVSFRGDNDNYVLSYEEGKWGCSCHFFSTRGMCSHTMALQRVLAEMLPEEAISLGLD